jgi:small-conductance mechanosensitive channel
MRWLAILLFLIASPVFAQAPPVADVQQNKVDQLLDLLRDPSIQTWLAQSKEEASVVGEPVSVAARWETETRQRIEDAVSAVARIPSEIATTAFRVRQDALSRGYAPVLLMLVGILFLGICAEAWFRTRRRGEGLLDQFLPIGVLTAVMAVVFFALPWPPLGRIVLLVCLSAFVSYRVLATAVGIAVEDAHVRRRARLFFAAAVAAIAMSMSGKALSVEPAVRDAISYLFSVILLGMALEMVLATVRRRLAVRLALCLAVVAIWITWCVGLDGLFWLGVYALLLPPLLRIVDAAVRDWALGQETRPIRQILLSRSARALVICVALAWLAFVWRTDTGSLAGRNPQLIAFLYGLLKSVAILLLVDLAWQLAKVSIEQRIAAPQVGREDAPTHTAAATRLRTLLPIFKNVLAVIMVVIAVLTVLAELGVEIGPLIAGAGIFGVALGFGSQTLVKDVISGVFYMLDDAFRVGEYIQAKSYKGTVEGFSLRSVRLRHHRGPVYTVPFGELGAVENMSRDWGVVKFRISVGYATDVEKARKLTKKIGATLLDDPELGPLFIEPLKMKGIEEFGDYGLEISFGMTLRPSPMQSFIRRRANLMLREAFVSNGIEFATPSVQVGGDEKNAAAAAATATRLQQAKSVVADG